MFTILQGEKVKRSIVFLILLSMVTMVFGTGIDEICKSSDVVVCKFADYVSIIDLNSGAEAQLTDLKEILGITFDKSGKKLYLLQTVTTYGKNYDDPGIHSIKILEMTLPSINPVVLTSFVVKPPQPDLQYSFPSFYLNKDGNLNILITFDMDNVWKRVFNPITKQLSPYTKWKYESNGDAYSFYPSAKVTNKDSKYFNRKEDGVYNLYGKDNEGNEYALTDTKTLTRGWLADEPLYYCVSPDGSRILFGTRDSVDETLGMTFSVNIDGTKLQRLSEDRWLGYEFIPYWTKDHKLVYTYNKSHLDEKEKTYLRLLNPDGSISDIRSWDSFWKGPLMMIYRHSSAK